MSTNLNFGHAADPVKSIPTEGKATGQVLGVESHDIMALAKGFSGPRVDPVNIAAEQHLARMILVSAGGGIKDDPNKNPNNYDEVKKHTPIDDDGAMFRASSDPKPVIPGLG